jgi:quercetin dioxygenase-like cupin family protein
MSLTIDATRRFHNPVQKDTVTFLETAGETGKAHTLVEVELAPGGGNPKHRHGSYAEHFEVLEGELTVHLDGTDHVLKAGETAVVEIGSLHNFSNRGDAPARFRVELRPGHRGFEKTIQVGYGLAADGLVRKDGTPKSLVHLALMSSWGDMQIAGPLAVLNPLLAALARRAERNGTARELTERYVTL